MEIKEIASLRPRAAASPIEIRVVRIWKPPFRDNETCFLLVDRHGDGIQAIAKGKDQSYAEKNLMPKSCYRIEGHACVESEPYVNTLSHPANLRIGVASTFTPVAESDDLPHQYFEFASPRKIQRICGNNKEVTDFIGLLLKVEDKSTKTQRPYVSLLLKDTSNENIEVALWEEISKTSTRFDRKAIEDSTYPTVIAVTVVKVKEFSNAKQLWSTRATYVYLNPRCAETEILITNFNTQETQHTSTGAQDIIRNKAITIVSENKTTIGDLIQKESNELSGQTFTFNGAITQITTTSDWYHLSCPKCRKIIYPTGDEWFCTADGMQREAKYMYRIQATISDDTCSINAVLFDEAVKALVGIECADLVAKSTSTDMACIPLPVLEIKGKPTKFHAQASKDTRSGVIRCVVNKVTIAEIATENYLLTIMPTPLPHTPQQPPSRSRLATKRLNLFPEGNNTSASKKPK
ncbi:hypothetical protein R6Q59_030677 [Mikania micrantha]